MKTVLVVVILTAVFAVGGYFGLPILIQKEKAGLKSDVDDVKQRLLKIEEYIKKEEEAKKAGQLPGDADIHRIIRTVNSALTKVTSLEDVYKREFSAIAETIKQGRPSLARDGQTD